jgi:peptidoglycan/xylan/chitin deacetylase (PgdA/CDA1 family)
VIILNFHGLGTPARALEPNEDRVWLSVARFEAILDRLAARDDVEITFDDGNKSDVELALPALRRRKLTATFFVVAGCVGQDGFLSEDDLAELKDAGMEIGSHGMRHRPWRRLDPAALREEFFSARDALRDRIGEPVRAAACPFGEYDRTALMGLRRAGFTVVMTSDRQPARTGDWIQPRYTVRRDDDDRAIEAILDGRVTKPQWMYRLRCVAKRWRI